MKPDAILEAKRAYMREWRRKNPDKVREINRRYWEKKAAQMQESEGKQSAKEES